MARPSKPDGVVFQCCGSNFCGLRYRARTNCVHVKSSHTLQRRRCGQLLQVPQMKKHLVHEPVMGASHTDAALALFPDSRRAQWVNCPKDFFVPDMGGTA